MKKKQKNTNCNFKIKNLEKIVKKHEKTLKNVIFKLPCRNRPKNGQKMGGCNRKSGDGSPLEKKPPPIFTAIYIEYRGIFG